MRFLNLILGAVSVGAIAAAGAGCSSSSTGGAGASTTTTTTKADCTPKATCTAVDKTCLGLVSNAGMTKFGLRMAELDVTKPAALTSGIIQQVVAGNVQANDTACNLTGTATFSWLLQFDTAAGTLKTGGAKPVPDATKGYAFDDEMIMQGTQTFHVAPISVPAKPDSTGNFTVSMGEKLIVPIFLDSTGASVVLLPLQQARIVSGTLSSNNDCIGTYNAKGLDPTANCAPSKTVPQFNDAGTLDGFLTLEDADTVVISTLQETLCVLLSNNPAMYGDGASPTSHCKRDPATMKITFQGDWCSTTNAAGTCADSVQLAASFAASSVLITN